MSGYYELDGSIKFDKSNANTTLQLNGNCLIRSLKEMTDPMIEVQDGGSFNIVGDELNSKVTVWNQMGTGRLSSGYNMGAMFETNGNQIFLTDSSKDDPETGLGSIYSLYNITIWANPKNEQENGNLFQITKNDNDSFKLSLTNCSVFDSRTRMSTSNGKSAIIRIGAASEEDDRRVSSSLMIRNTFFYRDGNPNLGEQVDGADSFIYADHESTKRPSNWLISDCIFYNGSSVLNGKSSGCIVTKIPAVVSTRRTPWVSIRMNNNEFNWNFRNSGGSPYIIYDIINNSNNRNSIYVINKGSSISSCNTIDNTVPIVQTVPNMIGAPNLFGPITLDNSLTINKS